MIYTHKVAVTAYIVKNKKLSAEAKVTWVFTNLAGRPIPIPKEIREAFEIHQ